jgi:hypothetical protein
VIDAYRQAVAEEESVKHREEAQKQDRVEVSPGASEVEGGDVLRWGSGEAEITAVRLLDASGAERYHFRVGEPVTVELAVQAHQALDDVVFGLALSTPRGVEVWGSNTDLAGLAGRLTSTATVRAEFPTLRLGPGDYALDAAIHTKVGAPFDYRRKVVSFSVIAAEGERGVGIYFPEHRWRFSGDLLMAHERDEANISDGSDHDGGTQSAGHHRSADR